MTTADAYIAAVRSLLVDLPSGERDELLEDLASHLAELAAEPGLSLDERLGPPSAYAMEFIASAGLTPPAALTPPAGPTSEPEAPSPRPARAWLLDFRPTWWALRPFVIAAAVVLIVGRELDAGLSRLMFVVLAGVVAAAAAAWSTRLGRGGGRWNLAWTGAGALAVAAVAAALTAGPVDRVVFAGPKVAAVRLGFECRAASGKIMRVGPDGRPGIFVTPDGGVTKVPGPDLGPSGPSLKRKLLAAGVCVGPRFDGPPPMKPGMTPAPQNAPTTTTVAPTTTTLPPPSP